MENKVIPLKLISRARTTLDWKCRRARWWGYEWGGRGVVSSNVHTALFLGTALHDGLAAIALEHPRVDIDKIACVSKQGVYDGLMNEAGGDEQVIDYANEQSSLVEGLLRGFYRHTWPRLMESYPTIKAIEQEMIYNYEGIIFACRPDLVLADTQGNLVYIEYKSTSSKKDNWTNSWDTAIQLHATAKAIESTLGEKVSMVVVQGLYKGFESYGKQSSPFCYAYKRNGNPPFTKDEVAYEYKAGFKRYPTWELEGGTKHWVENMPESILADQFPSTPPIFIKEDLISSYFRQAMFREKEIEMAHDMIEVKPDSINEVLEVSFPQSWDQCNPGFGSSCAYRMLCHGGIEDPLSVGFTWRDVEHEEAYRKLVEVPDENINGGLN